MEETARRYVCCFRPPEVVLGSDRATTEGRFIQYQMDLDQQAWFSPPGSHHVGFAEDLREDLVSVGAKCLSSDVVLMVSAGLCRTSVFLVFQALVNGNINSYLIEGLSPSSEYEVLLAAIYRNEVESDEIVLVESTGTTDLGSGSGFGHLMRWSRSIKSLLCIFS